MADLVTKAGEYTPQNIIAGNQVALITEGVVLAKGTATLKAGTVIALVTADSTGKAVDSSKTDGTQTPYGILAEDVTLKSSGTIKATVYVSGYFQKDKLVFGGNDTAATHKSALRTLGIYLV